jgi:hypothetical protein
LVENYSKKGFFLGRNKLSEICEQCNNMTQAYEIFNVIKKYSDINSVEIYRMSTRSILDMFPYVAFDALF